MKRIGLLLLLMMLWLAGASQAASKKYELILLDVPGDYTTTYAAAINNNHEIVGFCNDIHWKAHAVYWDPATAYTPIVIDTLAGYDTAEAKGINDSGDVVGVAYNSTRTSVRPFIWNKNQGLAALQVLPGSTYDEVYSIAGNGKAYGYSQTLGVACCYERGQPAVNISAGYTYKAIGCSDGGAVVGHENSARTNHVYKAVMGHETFTEIITLTPGTTSSSPTAVGTGGEVVGIFYPEFSSNYQGFLYCFGSGGWHLVPLGTLGGTLSGAMGVNDRSQAVGWSYTTSGLTSAFLFEYETLTLSDLNNLEVAGKPYGYRFEEAHGINHRGEIVGWGQPALAFLIRPRVLDVVEFIMLLLLD
jgi:hypothetical protein